MKEKTDHKTTRRRIYAPDTAIGVGLVSQMRDLKARSGTGKRILINKILVEEDFTLWRGACFADGNTEIGPFMQKVNSGGIV